jgi:benzoyl-CoA reductase/2-hydroxyglutaryl-CoA dehydratase subunit BcrC/BadD/HgdB
MHNRTFEREGAAWSLLFREISRQGIAAFERQAPVVWTTSYVFPMELIVASGLIPVDFELYAGLMSAANQTASTLRAADRASVPQDTCTIHRIAIGAALLEQLPRPDILVSTSHYCDGKPKTNEFMAGQYGVEYHLLDMPLEDTPAAREYLKSQLWAVFERLCALGGKRPDEGLLVEPIRHFNEMTRCLQSVNRIRMESPSPLLPENRGFTLNFMTSLLYGTPQSTEIYRALERAFVEARDQGTIPPETLRFLWLMASPTHQTGLFSFLEERGGRIVMEELSHCYWQELDERTPIASMAGRMLSNTFMGPAMNRARTAVWLAKQYRVDAALHFGHLPCRQSNGALQIIKDGLEAEGIRLINLEADLSDPTNFPEDRIRDQLRTHWEVLLSNKGRR